MQNPTLRLNSRKTAPIYTNDYIRLNVGEKGLGAHVITNYDLTNVSIDFIAEGFDGNLINGGIVNVTNPVSGEFNFIWPDALTNMSSNSGHPFKGQFTLTGPNFTDVLSPFLIIVRPTLGVQEGYRSTINTIDTMIEQTLNDLGALHSLAEQAQNSADGSLSDIKDYFNQQSNRLVSDVNQKINAINSLVAGLQTNVNNAINNTQNDLQAALAKIKADGANAINQVKGDAQTAQKKQSNEFTSFLENSENNLNAKLLNWQNALDAIKNKMDTVSANADTLKNRIDELNSNVGGGFADKKDLEALQKVVTSIQDSLKNFETSDTINNLKKELARKANKSTPLKFTVTTTPKTLFKERDKLDITYLSGSADIEKSMVILSNDAGPNTGASLGSFLYCSIQFYNYGKTNITLPLSEYSFSSLATIDLIDLNKNIIPRSSNLSLYGYPLPSSMILVPKSGIYSSYTIIPSFGSNSYDKTVMPGTYTIGVSYYESTEILKQLKGRVMAPEEKIKFELRFLILNNAYYTNPA